MRPILTLLALLLCGVLASARNFTVYHYAPGTDCKGEPFLTQIWSFTNQTCYTSIEGGTSSDNTPKAYQAYCERQRLALADSVNVLQVKYYYREPHCGFGTQEDEKPREATVTVSGRTCFGAGKLFPNSDVKVVHDCQDNSGNRIAVGFGTLFIVMFSAVIGLMA